MRRGMAALQRRVDVLLSGLLQEPVGLHLGRRDEVVARQLLGATQFRSRQLECDAGTLHIGICALDDGLGDLHPGVLLSTCALVEHRRENGRQCRDRVACCHRIAFAQCDARQSSGQRCGNDVAVSQARASVLRDGLLVGPDGGGRHLDSDAARRERPGQQAGQHRARGDRHGQVTSLHVTLTPASSKRRPCRAGRCAAAPPARSRPPRRGSPAPPAHRCARR